MYLLLVLLSTIALGAGFWIDNDIQHPILQWWWVFLVAGFVLLCVKSPLRAMDSLWRSLLVLVCTASIVLFQVLAGNTLLIYLAGGTTILIWIVAAFWFAHQSDHSFRSYYSEGLAGLIIMVAMALVLLPIPINRIQVVMPNLSAGTMLTLYKSIDDKPSLDAQFYNQINDHKIVTASLATEILFQQPHDPPILQIKISRPKIVVRLNSIIYETRLGFLKLPLLRLDGDQLSVLQVASNSSSFNMQMDRGRLLVDQLSIQGPAWVQLPHLDNHNVSVTDYFLVVLTRVIFWFLVCFGLLAWAPRRKVNG